MTCVFYGYRRCYAHRYHRIIHTQYNIIYLYNKILYHVVVSLHCDVSTFLCVDKILLCEYVCVCSRPWTLNFNSPQNCSMHNQTGI